MQDPQVQHCHFQNPALKANVLSPEPITFFLFGARAPTGPGSPHSWRFWIKHNDAPQSVGSSGWVISPSQRPLPDNTQHSQKTDIHAPGGIQNHSRSRQTAEDLQLKTARPLGLASELIYLYQYLTLQHLMSGIPTKMWYWNHWMSVTADCHWMAYLCSSHLNFGLLHIPLGI